MQTQIPGAAQPGTQEQPQNAMQSGMQPQIQGTMQPNIQTQVPGEGQSNAQAQTEKGQPISPEKRIPALTAAIKKSGLTTGKATIAAQEMVTEAEKRFGANSGTVLAAYQPGQNPRQFLNGFQNAYILGTQGNQVALEKSKAAAYLTPEQRQAAYELGTAANAFGASPTEEMRGKTGMPFAVDRRDSLENIPIRAPEKLTQGIAAFPEGDPLRDLVRKVAPDGNKYDVAMHGTNDSVAFGSDMANMSPRLLADVIRRSDGYSGQDIRLLACNTGYSANGEYCFAEELANALGVTVWAPNDLIFIYGNGKIKVGDAGDGDLVPYAPNERRRIK